MLLTARTDIRVVDLLHSNGAFWVFSIVVSRKDYGRIGQDEKLSTDRIYERLPGTALKVGPPYGVDKKGVAGEDETFCIKADAPGEWPGVWMTFSETSPTVIRSFSLTVSSAAGDCSAPNMLIVRLDWLAR